MSAKSASFDAAAFCARPLVRRVYKGSVVGLAVFIVTLVLFREPFRGYLGEVQISGPATAGLDVAEGAGWLKQVDPHTAVVASPAGERSPRSQIRMTYVARHAPVATARLDELAARWLCQYLPERLQAHRRNVLADLRSAVAAAREREDAARQRLDALRQQQLVSMLQPDAERTLRPSPGSPLVNHPFPKGEGLPAAAETRSQSPLEERLAKAKTELAQLLARCTEDHPEVITLRKQIGGMERELTGAGEALPLPAEGPELLPGTSEKHAAASGSSAAGHYVSTSSGTVGRPATAGVGLAATTADAVREIEEAVKGLALASRERQEAELRVNERMQELSAEPTAAEWTTTPARVVLRLGGTPRSATLAVGGLLAGIGALVMFRASATAVLPLKIQTPRELASLLEIPVVGNTSAARADGTAREGFFGTRNQVLLLTRMAEVVIAIAAGACLLSIAAEPALAAQVLADPFGALSEVIGRYLG